MKHAPGFGGVEGGGAEVWEGAALLWGDQQRRAHRQRHQRLARFNVGGGCHPAQPCECQPAHYQLDNKKYGSSTSGRPGGEARLQVPSSQVPSLDLLCCHFYTLQGPGFVKTKRCR